MNTARPSSFLLRPLRHLETQNVAIQLGTLALAFPLSIVVSRYLGPEGRGIFALTSMTAAVVALVANLGIAEATPFVLGRHSRDHGTEGVLLRTLAGPLGIGAVLFVPASLLILPRLGVTTSTPLVVIATLLMVLSATWPFWINIATSQARTRAAIKAEAIRVGVYSVGALAAIAAGMLTAVVALTALALSYAVTIAILIWRVHPIMTPTSADVARSIRREATTLGWRGMVARLLEYASSRIDVFIIGGILGPGAAGTYAVATGIAELTTMTAAANIPTVLHRLSTTKEPWGRFLLGRLLGSAGAAAVGAVVIIALGSRFIDLALGTAFDEAVAPLRILAVAAVALGAGRILRHANFALGRMRSNWWADFASIAVLVGGNLLFLRTGGLTTAALVIFAAHAVAVAVLGAGLTRHHYGGAAALVSDTPVPVTAGTDLS